MINKRLIVTLIIGLLTISTGYAASSEMPMTENIGANAATNGSSDMDGQMLADNSNTGNPTGADQSSGDSSTSGTNNDDTSADTATGDDDY